MKMSTKGNNQNAHDDEKALFITFLLFRGPRNVDKLVMSPAPELPDEEGDDAARAEDDRTVEQRHCQNIVQRRHAKSLLDVPEGWRECLVRNEGGFIAGSGVSSFGGRVLVG